MLKTYAECQQDGLYCTIKESTIQTLIDYVSHRVRPGGFVTALLANDLINAVGRADRENLQALPAICTYIYNELPYTCWGSYETVGKYLKEREE